MEDLISLCKRRGFIFPSSEIYGGHAGFFDYGPLGIEMKRNITNLWWRTMITSHQNMVGLDSSIITHPEVWVASGHVKQFCDPLIEDTSDGCRYRGDHLYAMTIFSNEQTLGVKCITTKDSIEPIMKLYSKKNKDVNYKLVECSKLSDEELMNLPSPNNDKTGTLKRLPNFNLMMRTNIGANDNISYLRPETAQGIFCNYKSILNSSRLSIPFGIGQIGKAF